MFERLSKAVVLAACAAGALAIGPAYGDEDHPLCKDKTGMRWVLPFTEAQKTADAGKRLLMIKPVAFGTSRDGGW